MPLFEEVTSDQRAFASLITTGQLRETHHRDFKEKMYPSGEAGTLEMLQDIAAFANDGGEIILGVVDEKNAQGKNRLKPLSLSGLSERIREACRPSLDPPLEVAVAEVVDPSVDDGTGYAVIRIPMSPAAPHMVMQSKGKRGYRSFMVRLGTQTLAASREQVAEALSLRPNRQKRLHEMLDRWQEESQLPDPRVECPMILIVAAPIGYPAASLVETLGSTTQVAQWASSIRYEGVGRSYGAIELQAQFSSDRIRGGSSRIDDLGQLRTGVDHPLGGCESEELLFTGELRRRHTMGLPPDRSQSLWLMVAEREIQIALEYLRALVALPTPLAHLGVGYRIIGGQGYRGAYSEDVWATGHVPFSGEAEFVADFVSADLEDAERVVVALFSELSRSLA